MREYNEYCKRSNERGGIILVHDYEYEPFPGVKKACDDFLKDKPEKVVKGMNGIGIMRKQ